MAAIFLLSIAVMVMWANMPAELPAEKQAAKASIGPRDAKCMTVDDYDGTGIDYTDSGAADQYDGGSGDASDLSQQHGTCPPPEPSIAEGMVGVVLQEVVKKTLDAAIK